MLPSSLFRFYCGIPRVRVGFNDQRYSDVFELLCFLYTGESFDGGEIQLYKHFLKSQLGNDVVIKSAKVDSSPTLDMVKSLTVHPFKQVGTEKILARL